MEPHSTGRRANVSRALGGIALRTSTLPRDDVAEAQHSRAPRYVNSALEPRTLTAFFQLPIRVIMSTQYNTLERSTVCRSSLRDSAAERKQADSRTSRRDA